jgi:hypothetical protein
MRAAQGSVSAPTFKTSSDDRPLMPQKPPPGGRKKERECDHRTQLKKAAVVHFPLNQDILSFAIFNNSELFSFSISLYFIS